MGTRLYPGIKTVAVAVKVLGLPASTVEQYLGTRCPYDKELFYQGGARPLVFKWIVDQVGGFSELENEELASALPETLEKITVESLNKALLVTVVDMIDMIEDILVNRSQDLVKVSDFLSDGWGKFENDVLLPEDEAYGGETTDPELCHKLWLSSRGCGVGLPEPDWSEIRGCTWY